ncbi:MAG: RNA chaperone Hfq [Clostridiales bacterium]|nr:RNA chaperone Hfq [Clostridiales bacterium]
MQKNNNLQDSFLTQVRRNRVSLTMFLMNGFQMHGVITGFDAFVVVLNTDGKQQVIYKHAISTITPEHPVDLREGDAAAGLRGGERYIYHPEGGVSN